MTLHDIDPVTQPVRDALPLFEGALKDVRFPDVDAASLATSAQEVEQRFAELRRLEASIDEAKRAVADAFEGLLQKTQRGLAYARVFAEGDDALRARLDAIHLPRPKAPKSPKPAKAPDTVMTATPDGAPAGVHGSVEGVAEEPRTKGKKSAGGGSADPALA